MKLRFQRHKGASLLEYMLVLVLIAGVCYGSLSALGISISKVLDNAIQTITAVIH
jgi:Flp pilus assembly pilin Flp